MHKIIASGNARLWARRDGDPAHPCILLVAGANASHLMWPQEFCDLLVDAGFCVLRHDHRDTGQSSTFDFAQAPYSLQDLAEDLIAVLDGFGVARAHAVGLSMGGTLVQVAALDHPDRLLSATVMLTAALDVDFAGNINRAYTGEPNPMGLPSPRREVLDVLARRREKAASREEELAKRTTEWLALSGPRARVNPAEFREWEARAIDHAGTLAQPVNHALAAPIPLARGQELACVRVPFLVIQGGQDPLNPPPHGRHIAGLIPTATYVEIPELGHSLPGSLHAVIAREIVAHARACDPAARQTPAR
ncbi:MAG: alpha/beta fold hydrolase [Pseudomonadota bacterium]